MTGKGMTGTLDRLFATIEARRAAPAGTSYTASLLAKGRNHIAGKVAEESSETIKAALNESAERLVSESADLLYHLLVLWAERGVRPEDVWAELERREGVSGLAEKAARSTRGKTDGL